MNFKTVDQLSDEQIQRLHRLYQLEWWTQGRQLADVRRLLRHSDVIVACCHPETSQLMAFARVLTDYVYKALILDVIVDSKYREAGLGRALLEAIINHSSLKSVQHFELYCLPDLVPFYQKWGFTSELGELCFLRRAA